MQDWLTNHCDGSGPHTGPREVRKKETTMQTNKHPVTSLPWHAMHTNGQALVLTSAKQTIAEAHRYGDNEYIAHAANAYPALIAALRAYSQGVERDDDGAVARATLRELGEE